MSNANECAYPCVPTDRSGQNGPMEYGLTKREAMAMHIMAGLATHTRGDFVSAREAAVVAVEGADALLAELERTE